MRLGTWVPFERLPEVLRLFTGAWLSASTIQRLTETAGAAYEAVQTAAGPPRSHGWSGTVPRHRLARPSSS